MSDSKRLLATALISAIVFGGIGFFIGKKFTSSLGPTPGMERMGDRGQFGQNAGPNRAPRALGGGTQGEVLSKNETLLTVKLRDGGSRIVFYATSTGVMRTASGTMEDIEVGSQVFVAGNQNADGSINAQTIQVRPDGGVPSR